MINIQIQIQGVSEKLITFVNQVPFYYHLHHQVHPGFHNKEPDIIQQVVGTRGAEYQ